MCGIYGSTIKYNPSQIKEKLERTSFRGPDASQYGFYGPNNDIILGHNRLAIIDLDPRSNQPFIYQHIHIVFNGEIYNFQEIKKNLIIEGYTFETTSDTEVICAAYLEYGKSFIKELIGMFALVIYDSRNQIMFGARDRMGQKPLYYSLNEKGLEFASQISSIQLHNDNLSISSKAIAYYLTWGNIPDPFSIFNEVKKLKAGHCFEFNLKTNTFSSEAYWDIDDHVKGSFQGSYAEAKKELSELIADASGKRLFADVPVGVFLSGGIDSSVIAALASKGTSSKVKTFSVKFEEEGFDESQYAEQVANHLNTEHHVIECNYNEGLDLIEKFYYYFDEPFADASAIPSMLLAKHTRKHVTVALSGDGGDESFIGYTRYKWIKQVQWMYQFPDIFRQITSQLLSTMPHYKLKTIAKGLKNKSINDLYLAIASGIDNSWMNSEVSYTEVSELSYLNSTKNLLERISDFDLKSYLIWDINTKVDRATMAYSLEARAPLLDHRIVEFARALPTDFKCLGNNQKRILKDVLFDHVPEEIFDRPKSGFTMPFSEWFRNDLKAFVHDELDSNSLKDIPNINIDEVQKRISQHMNGTWNRYPMIWKLLVLKQWLNKNAQGLRIV